MPFSSSRKTKQYLFYFYKQRNMKLHNSNFKKNRKLSLCINNYSFGAKAMQCIRLTYASYLNKNTVSDNMV